MRPFLNAELFIIMTFYITMYNRIKGVLYRFVIGCPEVEGGSQPIPLWASCRWVGGGILGVSPVVQLTLAHKSSNSRRERVFEFLLSRCVAKRHDDGVTLCDDVTTAIYKVYKVKQK